MKMFVPNVPIRTAETSVDKGWNVKQWMKRKTETTFAIAIVTLSEKPNVLCDKTCNQEMRY
jgi:hypothetical protein